MNVLSTFLNVHELPKRRLAQHSHILSGHLQTLTCFGENPALVRILVRLGALVYFLLPLGLKAVYFVSF